MSGIQRVAQQQSFIETYGDQVGDILGDKLGESVGLWPSSSQPSLSHASLFQAVPVGVSVLRFQDREEERACNSR